MTASARLASLLGPPGSNLRRWRLLLGAGLLLGIVYLLGPYQPWRLPGDPTLVPSKGQSRIHIVLVPTYWAVALNVLLCAVLLAATRVWACEESEPLAARAARGSRVPAATWALLLGACVVAGALRWNLAHGSVWWDEAWTVRNAIVGMSKPVEAEPGRVEFEPTPWLDTLWYYNKPTNHVLYSVTSRLSLAGWRALSGAQRSEWDEFAFRFPTFAAALLSVLLIGVLVHDLGFPRAAPFAGWLLAIHPWHVRFGGEGRGYALMVLLAIVAGFCLLHGLRGGRWRWWLGLGASLLGLLWVHPLAIYFPLSMAGAGALGVWLGPGTRSDRGVRLARLVVAMVMSGMAFVQLMAPNLAQGVILGRQLKQEPERLSQLAENIWIFASVGLHRKMPWNPDYSFPTLVALSGDALWPWALVFGLLPILALIGCVRLLRRPHAERFAFLGLAGGVPLLFLHRALADFLLIERFAIYLLVAIVPALVLGLEGALQALLPKRAARVGVPVGLALGLGAFQAFVAPQTRLLMEQPLMPSREVAEFLAAAGEGIPGGVIRAGVALGGNVPDVYDPFVEHVFRRDEIAALCRRSLAEGRPLYLFYGYNQANRGGPFKDVFVDLDDANSFEEVAHFGAVESEYVVRVLRFTGRPPGSG
jgi:hypothetical protein